MIIAGIFSFNHGKETVETKYPYLLEEIKNVISSVNANEYITKKSKEKTMKGKMLYNPVALNKSFKKHFNSMGWKNYKVICTYPTQYYTAAYNPKPMRSGAFRDMDFVKERLGVEVQFGKYAFMVYNVCAKMTIFNKLGVINAGVEIVPVKEFAAEMSTGVSYFEQFVWDLETRGSADIDIPVLIIGVSG